jgi:hypothetical protein
MGGKRRQIVTHRLKCLTEPFEAIDQGLKRFEFRKDDRGFQVGDELVLCEWMPEVVPSYTGRVLIRSVSYIARGPSWGIPEGFAVLSLKRRNARG